MFTYQRVSVGPHSDSVGELPEAKQQLLAQEKRPAWQNLRKAQLNGSLQLINDKLEADFSL
jgi:hypothetical protein